MRTSRRRCRSEGDTIENGNKSGLGDITLLAIYRHWQYDSPVAASVASLTKDGKSILDTPPAQHALSIRLHISAGLKLPTGNSSRLKEEGEEGHGHKEIADAHHQDEAER